MLWPLRSLPDPNLGPIRSASLLKPRDLSGCVSSACLSHLTVTLAGVNHVWPGICLCVCMVCVPTPVCMQVWACVLCLHVGMCARVYMIVCYVHTARHEGGRA